MKRSVGPGIADRKTPSLSGQVRRHRRIGADGDSLQPVTHRLARNGLFVSALVASMLVVSACGVISTKAPAPTPADFQGIAAEFVTRGIVLDHLVSGDAGCTDQKLTQTAIGFDASGLDQAEVVRVRIYIFRDAEAYSRLRSTIDACAAAFVTDASTFEALDESPFVLAGQGPWAPEFKAALRDALHVAAGSGD